MFLIFDFTFAKVRCRVVACELGRANTTPYQCHQDDDDDDDHDDIV